MAIAPAGIGPACRPRYRVGSIICAIDRIRLDVNHKNSRTKKALRQHFGTAPSAGWPSAPASATGRISAAHRFLRRVICVNKPRVYLPNAPKGVPAARLDPLRLASRSGRPAPEGLQACCPKRRSLLHFFYTPCYLAPRSVSDIPVSPASPMFLPDLAESAPFDTQPSARGTGPA